MRFIGRVISIACALIVVAYIIPGVTITGIFPAIVAAFCLGLLNAIVRPILVFFTFPITILTLGLFIFIINATLFFFVASVVNGFDVSGFMSALLGSIVVSLISSLIQR